MKAIMNCWLFPRTKRGSWVVTLALALAWPAQAADPVLIGRLPGVSFFGVAADQRLAYLADGNAGLQVIDMCNRFIPRLRGSIDTSGFARGVAVSGYLAYVADGNDGLHVIDVSNPFKPRRMGGYNTGGVAIGVAVSGNYAYVADGKDGLKVINVSDPFNPFQVAHYATVDARDVVVSGDFAYVADGDAGLQVIDVRNPANPQNWNQYDYDPFGLATGVAVSGKFAYVADGAAGLHVMDMTTNRLNPKRLGGYNTGGAANSQANSVVVNGNLAYVADGNAGMLLIDVSDPARPTKIGGYATSGYARGVALSGSFIYVTDDKGGLSTLLHPPPPPRPAQIIGITRSAGTATIRYTTISGKSYTLEYRQDLSPGNWQTISTKLATGFSDSQTDASATNNKRFYRISQ